MDIVMISPEDGTPTDARQETMHEHRIRVLTDALKQAREALYWHDGMAFQCEKDGPVIGQLITNLLGDDGETS